MSEVIEEVEDSELILSASAEDVVFSEDEILADVVEEISSLISLIASTSSITSLDALLAEAQLSHLSPAA
jgi:hypothetical protein